MPHALRHLLDECFFSRLGCSLGPIHVFINCYLGDVRESIIGFGLQAIGLLLSFGFRVRGLGLDGNSSGDLLLDPSMLSCIDHFDIFSVEGVGLGVWTSSVSWMHAAQPLVCKTLNSQPYE